jgi:glycosyltransferase involved in cell wall biosynthesis
VSGSTVRVLHVAQPTDYGVARYIDDLVAGQLAIGWSVIVACPPDGMLAGSVVTRGAHHISWSASRNPGPEVAAEIVRLRQVVNAVRPDLVHLHSSKAGLAGRAALRRARPTIFQPHAWSFLTGPTVRCAAARLWEQRASRWSDAIVCGSCAEQQQGVSAGIAAHWHVVPNAIDVAHFTLAGDAGRQRARRSIGVGDEPLVVCVGRLCAQKGQDLLLDAWPLVRAAVPEARLVLVGDGPDRQVIEARDCPGVELAGRQGDVRPWLWAADVVVQPSRYETMALSMLEAMACGRSVVATDIEGAREALGSTPGVAAGALVAPGDWPGMSGSLIRRLRDPGLCRREGLIGRRRVEARHDRRALTAAVETVVDDVLRRSAWRRRRRREPTRNTRGD